MHWPRIRCLAASAGVRMRANETNISAVPCSKDFTCLLTYNTRAGDVIIGWCVVFCVADWLIIRRWLQDHRVLQYSVREWATSQRQNWSSTARFTGRRQTDYPWHKSVGYNILYFVAAYNGANCRGGDGNWLFPRKPLSSKWDILLSGVSDMRGRGSVTGVV